MVTRGYLWLLVLNYDILMVICQLLLSAQIVCNDTDLCLSKIFLHCITFVILFMVTCVETCGYLCYLYFRLTITHQK